MYITACVTEYKHKTSVLYSSSSSRVKSFLSAFSSPISPLAHTVHQRVSTNLYYYTSRMQMSLHKYVLFYPYGRNSTAIITKIAGYLRILMNRWFFSIFWINIC